MLPTSAADLLDPPDAGKARVILMRHPADGRGARAVLTADNWVTTTSTKRTSMLDYDGYGRTAAKQHISTLDATRALKSHLNRRHAEGFEILHVVIAKQNGARKEQVRPSHVAQLLPAKWIATATPVAVTDFWPVTTRSRGTGSGPKPKGATGGGLVERADALVADFREGRKEPLVIMQELVELRAQVSEVETSVVRAKQTVESLELAAMTAYVNGGTPS